MKLSLASFKRSALASAVAAVMAVSGTMYTPPAQAFPVFDITNFLQALLDELTQLDMLYEQELAHLQQLREYRLQLENLKQLPGSIRNEIKDNLKRQLLNNVQDYGRSLLNKTATQNPNAGSYYVVAEDILALAMDRDVPRTLAKTTLDLVRLGMKPGKDSGLGRDSHVDRMHFDRIMDDLRQIALSRHNAENRGEQANVIAKRMAEMSDNNTVGAIQLLSAQNSLSYAQNEDLIKAQAAMMKAQQENEVRLLVEKEAARKHELNRLAKIRAETQQTNVQMVPGTEP